MRLKSFIIPIAFAVIGVNAFLSSCSCNKEDPIRPEQSDTGVVELPEQSGLSYEELVIYEDGISSSISNDGHFESSGGSMLVFNNNNNLVYFSFGGDDDEVVINSSETAVSMLLPFIPLSVTDMDDGLLRVLKLMLANMDEVKALAKAIDDSIGEYGFTDMDYIRPQLVEAAGGLKSCFGLDAPSDVNRVRRSSPTYPYFSDNMANHAYGDGFDITLAESILSVDNEGRTYWDCSFDILNADRFCYTALIKCHASDEGGWLASPTTHEIMSNLIKPMNVSAFMDFGTLSDLATKPSSALKSLTEFDMSRFWDLWSKTIKNIGHKYRGEDLEEFTFDKIQVKGAKLAFYSPNEHLAIIGPGFSDDLLFINYLKIVVQPGLKLLLKEEKKGDPDIENDISYKFYSWLAKVDPVFIDENVQIMKNKDIGFISRVATVSTNIFKKFFIFAKDEALKDISGIIVDKTILKKGYDDPAVKAFLAAYESVLTAGDMLQFFLDQHYNALGFRLTQGIFETGGGLEDIPGSDL